MFKKTYWFEMSYSGANNGTPQKEEGISEVRWFKISELDEILKNTYENLKELVRIYAWSWILNARSFPLFILIALPYKKFVSQPGSKLFLKTVERRFGKVKNYLVLFIQQKALRKRPDFIPFSVKAALID